MHITNAKEFLKLVHTGPLFLETFSKNSYCSHYSISVNFLLKIGTVTPKDIHFPKIAGATSISEIGIALFYTPMLKHTPLEGLSGSVQSPRPMILTQLFFGISGIQNRFDRNFLTRTFSVIAI